jgi:predicted GIY-YIG superfamily endonuclease
MCNCNHKCAYYCGYTDTCDYRYWTGKKRQEDGDKCLSYSTKRNKVVWNKTISYVSLVSDSERDENEWLIPRSGIDRTYHIREASHV